MKTFFFSFIYSLLLLCNATNKITSFNLESLPLSSFKFLGDAHIFNGTFRLSRDLGVPNSGAGEILFRKPIRVLKSVSFTTSFSISITNSNKDSSGGGMALVMSPDHDAIGEAGGNLGIPPGAIAIEFDTKMDVEFEDLNGNHVGLDLGSMVSSKAVNLDLYKVDLRSGRPVNVWVDYSGSIKQLNTYVSHGNTKPKIPVLSVTLYLNDYMYIGFSGSTQASTEVHSVKRWIFLSYSDSKPGGPRVEKQSKFHHLSGKIIAGIVVAVVGVGTIVGGSVGYYYCIRDCYCCNDTSITCCVCGKKKKVPSKGVAPVAS